MQLGERGKSYLKMLYRCRYNVDLKSFGHQSNLQGILFESENDINMTGKPYKTLQRAYPTDYLLETKTNFWNQEFKITDFGTRWRECWNINNTITIN